MLNNYNEVMDSIEVSEDVKKKTAELMKNTVQMKNCKKINFAMMLKCATAVMVTIMFVLGAINIPKMLKPAVLPTQPFTNQSSTDDGKPTKSNGLYHSNRVKNILLIGVDESKKYADCVMLLSIDKQNKEIKLVSFLRDLYLDIPENQPNKLNTSYSIGNTPLTVKTVEKNFGIAIDNYVTVNFEGFEKAVEQLNGITVRITEDEAKLVNKYSGEPQSKAVKAGDCLLTGKQALYYCRIRQLDSDYRRTQRQRKIMSSILSKAKSSEITVLSRLLFDSMDFVTTNFNKNDLTELASNIPVLLKYLISERSIPLTKNFNSKTVKINGYSTTVIEIDMEQNKKALAEYLYGDDVNELE